MLFLFFSLKSLIFILNKFSLNFFKPTLSYPKYPRKFGLENSIRVSIAKLISSHLLSLKSRFYSHLSNKPFRSFDNSPPNSWALLFLIHFFLIHLSSCFSCPVRHLIALLLLFHTLGVSGTEDRFF